MAQWNDLLQIYGDSKRTAVWDRVSDLFNDIASSSGV
jgi:hypothetical protein